SQTMRRTSSSACLLLTIIATSPSVMRGFSSTYRRTTRFGSWARIMRASLPPRMAVFTRSMIDIRLICTAMAGSGAFGGGMSSCTNWMGIQIASVPAWTSLAAASARASSSVRSRMLLRARRLRVLDDLVGDVRRHLVVVRELHLEVAAALRQRAQIRRVAQHLGERHVRADPLLADALRLGAQHAAAAAVQVADDVPHVLVGDGDRDQHDRLEQ